MRRICVCIIPVLVAGLVLYALTAAADTGQPEMPNLDSHTAGAWGIDLTDRDPSVKPGDDFYMSQNGAWYARTELNAAQPMAAYWRDLRRRSPARLIAILDDVSADKSIAPDSMEGMAGAFYRAFLDEKTIESKGLAPLAPELARIRAIKTRSAMTELMGEEAGPYAPRSITTNVTPPRGIFTLNIAQDSNDPARYAVYVGQGGLMMPGPEFYTDPKLKDFKAAYQAYVDKMLGLIGWPEHAARARDIVAFETHIAEVSWSHEQMLDKVKTYNRMSITELSKLAPAFGWKSFFKGAELGKADSVVIDAKSAFPKIAAIYAATPISVLRARQAFDAAEAGGEYLDADMAETVFGFRGKVFTSASLQMQPRKLRAEWAVEASIPDIIAAIYVKHYFSPEARAKATEMAMNMKTALDTRLQNLSWMSPETKVKARDKLARMEMHIGYPDHFRSYAGLDIEDSDIYGDIKRSEAYNWREQVGRLGKPFDRSLWGVLASYPTYNYNLTSNTMEIPAAMLQPPFFDLNADAAVNYGAVGVTIGQMIMTAFDDQGRHYNADGRLQDWWTAEDVSRFTAESGKLSAQYSAMELLPGLHVNGPLVLNEAVTDLGGMLISLDAYHLSLKGQAAPVLDGFTGDQRFFLGRAQMWRVKFPTPFIRTQLATGANAYPPIRVNGPMRNIDDWYKAFDVQPGDKMYIPPEERVHLW